MDELDLTQFKDLVGDLDGKGDSFDLDSIMKEVSTGSLDRAAEELAAAPGLPDIDALSETIVFGEREEAAAEEPAPEAEPVWEPAPEPAPVWEPAPEAEPAWKPAPEAEPEAEEAAPAWNPQEYAAPAEEPEEEEIPDFGDMPDLGDEDEQMTAEPEEDEPEEEAPRGGFFSRLFRSAEKKAEEELPEQEQPVFRNTDDTEPDPFRADDDVDTALSIPEEDLEEVMEEAEALEELEEILSEEDQPCLTEEPEEPVQSERRKGMKAADEWRPKIPGSREKKHFWDSWDVPEEPEMDEEHWAEASKADAEDNDAGGGFLSRLIRSAEAEEEEEQEAVPEEEKPEVFRERKPGGHFWDRWLSPRKLDDLDIEPEPEEEEPEYEPEEIIRMDEAAVPEPEAPAEPSYTVVTDSTEPAAETARPEQAAEPDMPEYVPELPEEEPEEPRQTEAAAPEKTPRWKKWFAPIDEDEPEETAAPAGPEAEAAEPKTEQAAPVISREEMNAFLAESKMNLMPAASFEELMEQSGVEMPENYDPSVSITAETEDENHTKTQYVYVDLDAAQNEPQKPAEPAVWAKRAAASRPRNLEARTFPEPVWIHMPLEKIAQVAPQVERRNGEPVLLSEVRHMQRQYEKSLHTNSAQAAPAVSPRPKEHSAASSAAESSGDGNDEVSGGNRTE